MNFGKPMSAKRAKFRKVTRGARARGSKYDVAIAAICDLQVDQYLPIELPEGEDIKKFRAMWSQMLSSKVRKAKMEAEGVTSRVELPCDYQACLLEGVDDRIAIVCTENEYTAEDEKRDKERTKKAQKTRKQSPQPKKSKTKVEETEDEDEEEEAEEEDDEIEF
jgi:hypothetical protein